MSIRTKEGRIVTRTTIIDDVLRHHLATEEIIKKRNLTVQTREELLTALQSVILDKGELDKVRKGLIRNDSDAEKKAEKQAEKEAKKEAKKSAKNSDNLCEKKVELTKSSVENILEELEKDKVLTLKSIQKLEANKANSDKIVRATLDRWEKAKKLFLEAERELNEAEKAYSDSLNASKEIADSIDGLKENLNDIESKIEATKREIVYLVAPGYCGPIPELGKFVSSAKVDGIENLIIENIDHDLDILPVFEEMVLFGFDSATEFMQSLKFVSLISKYILNEIEFNLLNTDKRIDCIIKKYI